MKEVYRFCKKCGCEDTDQFRKGRNTICIPCYNSTEKERWRSNYNKRGGKPVQPRTRDILNDRLQAARTRAKEKGWEFSLTKEILREKLIAQEERCFYTGVPFNDGDKRTSMSLDRIDSKSGYTPENTVFALTQINKMKSDMSFNEFLRFSELIVFHKQKYLAKNLEVST